MPIAFGQPSASTASLDAGLVAPSMVSAPMQGKLGVGDADSVADVHALTITQRILCPPKVWPDVLLTSRVKSATTR